MPKKKFIEDHLYNKPLWIKSLFKILNKQIEELDKVEVKVTNPYIGYKLKVKNKRSKLFVEVHIQNTKIELHLRKLDYKNRTSIIIKDAPASHKWTLTKLVDINSESNLENVMGLIEQSYDDVFNFSL